MGIIMTNMLHWIYYKCKTKRAHLRKSHFWIWRPVYLLMLSTIMVMFQPVSILVIGSWKIADNLYWYPTTVNTAFPAKTGGWMIQIFLTWGGFLVMFAGVNDATNLIGKFKNKWLATRKAFRAENA